MSSSSQADTTGNSSQDATAPERPRAVQLLRDWGAPVLLGVVFGFAILAGMKLLESEACRIVMRWEWSAFEQNAELEDELKALGDGARKDLRECYLSLDGSNVPEMLVWTALIQGREPYLDARFLSEQAAKGETWQRRCAAVALVEIQEKVVDVELVLPPLLDWLGDLSAPTHEDPIGAVGRLLFDGAVPADWIERVRDHLIVLSDRAGRGLDGESSGDESDPDIGDRTRAIEALGALIADEVVLAHARNVAADEDEYTEVRVMALRIQAENEAKQPRAFDPPEFWIGVGRSANAVIRDTVAANLFRARDPAFNKLLLEMHSDASAQVRTGSLATQRDRRFHTPLAVIHELLEDSDKWVRRDAILSCLTFKNQPDPGPRTGHVLRILAESPEKEDVKAALVFLFGASKQAHGIRSADVSLLKEDVNEGALLALMNDTELRAQAVAAYAKHFGGAAVFTDEDRRKVLTKMLQHKDPDLVTHAQAELDKLK